MKDINPNKEQFLQNYGFKLDINKESKDVLSKKDVKVKDILGSKDDKVINKMSDIFPKNSNNDTTGLG